MPSDALRALRELVREREELLTFADLSEPLLEDLAVGWLDGRPFAEHAAEYLARVDGIPPAARSRELAGRAALALIERRRAGSPKAAQDQVRLLGDPGADPGDAEAMDAFDRRERQYESLTAQAPAYSPSDFAADAAGAFAAARERASEGKLLPADEVAADHALALLGQRLPPGLRAWFHERYAASAGAAGADLRAWTFVLAGRSLARHRDALAASGQLEGQGTAVPRPLLDAVLATDLGQLARTAVVEA